MAKKGQTAPKGYVSLYYYGKINCISLQTLHARKKTGTLPMKDGYIKANYKWEWEKAGPKTKTK